MSAKSSQPKLEKTAQAKTVGQAPTKGKPQAAAKTKSIPKAKLSADTKSHSKPKTAKTQPAPATTTKPAKAAPKVAKTKTTQKPAPEQKRLQTETKIDNTATQHLLANLARTAAAQDSLQPTSPQPAAHPSAQPSAKPQGVEGPTLGSVPIPNFEALSLNMGRMVEEAGKAMVAYMKPAEEGRASPQFSEQVTDAVSTLGHVAEYWLSDHTRALEAQTKLTSGFLSLWSNTLQRMTGEENRPMIPADPSDKRFANPEWQSNPFFDFLRQAYTLSSVWATDLVERAELTEEQRQRAQFYMRQVTGALSPANFIATNPELIRETLRTSGENLVRGMHMLAEDVEAGHGQLRIRQSDNSKFELGIDMATTPGKVVYRNDLMELIQYAPTTPQVFKRPVLIVPPWINKFYILDLNPEKSLVRWMVSQGLTVFVVSWVNPDARHAHKDFESYMREGILAACDAITAATGETEMTAIGYCVGGTLLAVTLAYLAAIGDKRIVNATFFTTQVDFKDAGDLKIFIDPDRVKSLEDRMKAVGYLDSVEMASAFNMLRPNELIWNYVINNYLKGKEPMPFDLLTWNSDSTRMPAANHSFYMRNCYLENTLSRGMMKLAGQTLDLAKVKMPIYNLAAREDHIAPALSVFNGAKLFGGPMRYVLAGSGHIAGVVNPVSKPKYQFWTGPDVSGTFDEWIAQAQETAGTWWNDWSNWFTDQAQEMVPAREPGAGKLKALCDAPGEYVRVKS